MNRDYDDKKDGYGNIGYQSEWLEPAYSPAQETMPKMYTPGIYMNQQYNRSRYAENKAKQDRKLRSSRFVRFARSACLVLACAILSGATSYGIIEYRFSRGDFTVISQNQVTFGGQQENRYTTNLAVSDKANGVRMSAEDIYLTACTQVVRIITKTPSMGGLFNGGVPVSTTSVVGSGFIISNDGYILTNYHVVETAFNNNMPLMVCLNDGTEFEAKVIGYDKDNDVALIKIMADGLNPAVIANSDDINVGQTVYAVGNPLGDLVYTMTDGIVSASDREVSIDGKTITTFQFSAAVNSGNSGGPVYNAYGEVIGIVTAKPMINSVEGIGFAIPINDAILIASELIEHGYITGRPLIGIEPRTVSRANAEYWGWVEGVRIMSIEEGSAAEAAKLMIGDIIIGIGETDIISEDALIFAMRRFRAGDTTTLTIWREGEELVITITFDENKTAGQVTPK